jgi:hypothetical protein
MDGRILERENTYSELVHKSKLLCFFLSCSKAKCKYDFKNLWIYMYINIIIEFHMISFKATQDDRPPPPPQNIGLQIL